MGIKKIFSDMQFKFKLQDGRLDSLFSANHENHHKKRTGFCDRDFVFLERLGSTNKYTHRQWLP